MMDLLNHFAALKGRTGNRAVSPELEVLNV
jgi:hypothetical protein